MEREEEESGGGVKEERREAVRVLVVDDSIVDRKIVERMLLKNGTGAFEVVAVDSGKKAMEVLGLNKERTEPHPDDARKIDIILTDYCMPEMNGYDLLEAVKVKSIPVVIMSSENESQRISRCEASGAKEFIIKPLRADDIQRLRNYAISGAPTATAAAASVAGSKRKLAMPDGTDESNRRPRLAGVIVA